MLVFGSTQRLFDLFMLVSSSVLWITSKRDHTVTTEPERIKHMRDRLEVSTSLHFFCDRTYTKLNTIAKLGCEPYSRGGRYHERAKCA